MRIITVVVCTLLTSTLLYAQSGSNVKFDGTWWNGFSYAEKVGFVEGWSEARTSTAYDECMNDPASSPRESREEKVRRLEEMTQQLHSCVEKQNKFLRIPDNYTYGQFVDGMDKLYADYRNRLIPVFQIAEEVEQQINGASDQQIETDLEGYRKIAQRTQSQ